MKTYQAELLFEVCNALGEGPLWHPIENRLYWTDILTGTLYRSNPAMTAYDKTYMDVQVGAFAFRKNGGMILATSLGFMERAFEEDKSRLIWNPLPYRRSVRLNDGKVDLLGRFWAGSLDPADVEGALYRLDPDGSQHTLLTGIGISNGLDWSPDNQTMYYTDSSRYSIYQFSFDLHTGSITDQQIFVKLPQDKNEIVPDGLCVDAEGYVWSAQWNGWQVVRYDPYGNPAAVIKVPAKRVTSCCFGGPDLDHLIITTSRANLSKDDLMEQPNAGDIFICKVDTQGQPTNLFG